MSRHAGSLWRRREVALLVLGVVLGRCLYHNLLVVIQGGHHIVCTLPWQAEFQGQQNVTGRSQDDLTGLLFVGVMTSRRYLRTRVRDICDTWGSLLNGSIVFFVGEGDAIESDLPVEILHTIADTEYPPQRKSFAMLDFMYRKFGQKFAWFLRADDDLFVDVKQLETLLHSLNDSLIWYLGHPGTGRPEEEGRLGLPPGSAYCMGGTGVLLSRDVLGALSGRYSECLKNIVSNHEDSELGRCVYNITGLPCSNTPNIYLRFKQNYDDTSGLWLKRAMQSLRPYVTFHPVKDTRYMYLGSALLSARRFSELQVKIRQLTAAIQCLDAHILHKCHGSFPSNQKGDSLCGPVNGSSLSVTHCDFHGVRRRKFNDSQFPNNPWSLVTRNALYTLSSGSLKKPADYAGVSVGLTRALQHLVRHLRRELQGAGRLQVASSDQHYRRVLAAVGVEHVTFVRLTPSNVRPYLIKQEFDELQLV